MPKMNIDKLEELIRSEEKGIYDYSIEYTGDINKPLTKHDPDEMKGDKKISRSESYTLLHVAIEEANEPAVKWLLGQSADPELSKKFDERIAVKGYYNGWKVKTSTQYQKSCLVLASGNSEITKLLSDAVRNKLAKEAAGASPLSRLNFITEDSKKASATAGASTSSDASVANVSATPKSTIS